MPKNDVEHKDIDKLLAEADELIRQMDSDAVKDLREEHRLQFEKHSQNFKKIKSELQSRKGKESSKKDSGAQGMHEAILDIVKAMHNFKKNLF